MPAFLLHVLNPCVFPIFDQHVERARRFLTCLPFNSGSIDIGLGDYAAYHDFWVEFTGDLGIDLLRAEYIQIKQVDNALWSIGRNLKPRRKSNDKRVQRHCKTLARSSSGGESNNSVQRGGRIQDTSSPEFINRVFSYWEKLTQKESMGRAAEELGLKLPDSYLKYPALHIYRWRKQGYST